MANKTITVFEHETLYINDGYLSELDFEALIRYNEAHGDKFFRPGLRKIKFGSYVGVIQVGNTIIEILPKADKHPRSENGMKAKWQNVLLEMLKAAGYIKLNSGSISLQKQKPQKLLDVFLFSFVEQVESLVHAGLVKKYRKHQQNTGTLKGRLLIEKQISFNIIHKERFYVQYMSYDKNNRYNGLLKTALNIIADTTKNPTLKQISLKTLLHFEDVDDLKINTASAELPLDRKTMPYKEALVLARMIVLNYSPGLSAGKKPVLALLFDMNRLFEKFIYRMLKRSEPDFNQYSLEIAGQNIASFWEHKTIRPDIIVRLNIKAIPHTFLIDTKWKIVSSDQPGDDDLKQMFTYNIQFGGSHAILVYPSVGQPSAGLKKYKPSRLLPHFAHGCQLIFINLFEENCINIDKFFAKKFLDSIINPLISSNSALLKTQN